MNSYKNLKFYLFLILILIQHKSWSQNTISIGPTISSGSKSFPINGRFGFGGSFEYVHNIKTRGGVRFNVGYNYFKNRYPVSGSQDSLIMLEKKGFGTSTLLPIRVGYQHFLFKDVAFLYAEAGMSVLHRPTHNNNYDLTKNLFTYALGFGNNFSINESQVIQLSVFYNYNKLYENLNLNYFSLRAAYGFNVRKVKTRVATQ